MTKDEALKMAIECLEYHFEQGAWGGDLEATIHTCKEALEQPKLTDEKGRPMTYWGGLEQPANLKLVEDNGNGIKTYEILPTHQWQGLTDDEISQVYVRSGLYGQRQEWIKAYNEANAKLKEKNI